MKPLTRPFCQQSDCGGAVLVIAPAQQFEARRIRPTGLPLGPGELQRPSIFFTNKK